MRRLRQPAERAWFALCLVVGRMLRSGRYSKVRLVEYPGQHGRADSSAGSGDGERLVLKRRVLLAPLVVSAGGLLMRAMHTGVRILPQRQWEYHERDTWESLYNRAIHVDEDGTLVLPWLSGRTLAAILDDPTIEDCQRTRAIGLAVASLAELHRRGFSHGDAMAENVIVDLAQGVARWFDFETIHRADRSMVWRRADDLRALLATCVIRTARGKVTEILALVLDTYADDEVNRVVAKSFASTWHRALPFHLGQAALSFRSFQEIGGVLHDREAKRADH